MEISEFKEYTGCFHDGTIDRIERVGSNINIWMESVVMLPEWLREKPIHVNQKNCIKGVLHCVNVKKNIVNNVPQTVFKQIHDYVEILEFEIQDRDISLLVIWRDWATGFQFNISALIKIESERAYWEHKDYVSSSDSRFG